MYIKRTLERVVKRVNKEYSCILLIGPRQVGKSTMLEHLMEGTGRSKVALDNMEERRLAKADPELFLEMHPAPILIDEVQYAPELFSYIKMRCDEGAPLQEHTGSRDRKHFRLWNWHRNLLPGGLLSSICPRFPNQNFMAMENQSHL